MNTLKKIWLGLMLGLLTAANLPAQTAVSGHAADAGSVAPDSGGDVVGPASSTNNAFARWSGTTGKLLQDTSDLTYSSPTMSVPDSFVVSSAGSIGLTAGGSDKNVTITPSGTGNIVGILAGINSGLSLTNSAVGGPFIYLNATNATAGNRLTGVTLMDANTQQWGIQLRTGDGKLHIRDLVQNVSAIIVDVGATSGTAGQVRVVAVLPSTTNTSGALIVGGGAGIAGDLFANDSSITHTSNGALNTFGIGGTAANVNSQLILNGSSASSSGVYLTLKRNSVTKAYIGTESVVQGNTSDSLSITSVSDAVKIYGANTLAATFTNTTTTLGGNLVLGASTSSITGAAGNMTITAGTGNSRTLALQTTTSGGTATTFLSGDATQGTTLAGALIGANVQALSGAGAVDVTHLTTEYTSTGGAQALTLANGTAGQIKYIVHGVDGGSGVLTPTTKTGFSTITFTNAGDSVTLVYIATRGWCIVGIFGAVAA